MQRRAETAGSFENLVREMMAQEQISFVLAIYRIIDEWSAAEITDSGLQLACRPGCDFCCHQLVTCTEIEWTEIKKYIESLDSKRRYWFSRRLQPFRRDWKRWYRKRPVDFQPNPLKVYRDWLGKPCPFLNEGRCDIYPVRPIDCRTLTSTQTCIQWENQEGAKRFRFDWELWANNIIMDEQGRLSLKATTPLLHWICTLTI